MKFTIQRDDLIEGLRLVHGVAESRNSIPILRHVLISARDGGVTFAATDMEVRLNRTMACEVSSAGECAVPATTLYKLATALPDQNVEFEHEQDRAVIRGGDALVHLHTLPALDFPDSLAKPLPDAANFAIPLEHLRRLVANTIHAVATEDTRYYLNGIYLHASKGNLWAVATDGHRLAASSVSAPNGAHNMAGIIHRRAARLLLDIARTHDGNVAVEANASYIRFASGDYVLTSKLIDGTFPDYARVIPTTNDKIARVRKGALADALGRANAIENTFAHAVRLDFDNGALRLSAQSVEYEDITETIAADYEGPSVTTGFQIRYLSDAIGQMGEFVEFRLLDGAGPAIIVDPNNADVLHVLMPMRVR